MIIKETLTYESPNCRIVLIQPGRILDGSSPQASTKDISYEDI